MEACCDYLVGNVIFTSGTLIVGKSVISALSADETAAQCFVFKEEVFES